MYCDSSRGIDEILPEPSGNPSGSSDISSYTPPLVTIQLQSCTIKEQNYRRSMYGYARVFGFSRRGSVFIRFQESFILSI